MTVTAHWPDPGQPSRAARGLPRDVSRRPLACTGERSGPEDGDPLRALEELKAGLPGHELLGPAPLLRLRNRHRAQLVGKTDRPRALAARAAALLAAAAPAMRRAGLAAVVDVDPQSL